MGSTQFLTVFSPILRERQVDSQINLIAEAVQVHLGLLRVMNATEAWSCTLGDRKLRDDWTATRV